ncbi:permease [Fodinibius saliphilus]|uniref:permease n=1 Tax=Fodinibius saliphilus TaxID=1920650 RepID=UPI0011094844|nr:permease [Fodinibius saliphilus]
METFFDQFISLADYLVYDAINISRELWYAEALHFFIANFSKIFVLLVIAIYIMNLITDYLSYERIGAYLEKNKQLGTGNILASSLGVVSPFCSCSSVPLFVSMMQGRVPLGISLSFLITSPLVNEVAIAVFWATYGWKVTFIYVASGIILGVIGGITLEKLGYEKHVADWIKDLNYKETTVQQESRTFRERLTDIHQEASTTIIKLVPYIFVGMVAGSLIHGYVPRSFFQHYMPENSLFAVPLSVIMAIPLYLDAVSVLPVIESLIGKGVPMGTAIAFMMGAIGLSLPEALLLKKVMKKKLLIAFFTTIGIGMVISGYFFNMIF